MIHPIPTKKEIRAISKDIESSIQETLFAPLLATGYDKTDNPLEKDWENGKIKYKDGKIKGKLSLASLVYLQKKGLKYDKGYIVSDPEIQLFLAHKEIDFTDRKQEMIKFLDTIDEVKIGIDKELVFSTIDKIEDKARKVLGVKTFTTDNQVPNEMYDSLDKSATAYFALLVSNLTKTVNGANNNKEVNEALKLKIAQLKRRAYQLADDASFYYGGQARMNLYQNYGAKFFVWKTMGDDKVRESHQVLNKKVFEYANPPIVDGEPRLPSESYGCRCLDIVILPKKESPNG